MSPSHPNSLVTPRTAIVFRRFVLIFALCGAAWTHAVAASSPPIPVGLDAYRLWERWPWLRTGQRTYMSSTYDRRGGNEGADASHFLYQLAEDKNVTLDLAGPGVLSFARYNHWHGSPWHYEIDGRDYLVQETSTAVPNHPSPNSRFLPEEAFPAPLTWTWSVTKGADLMWVPVAFEHSFQMAYSRTHYGTGYYIYNRYVPGTKLSRPLRSWNPKQTPDRDVLELISRAGSDLLPPLGSREARRQKLQERTGTVTLAPHSNMAFLELSCGSAPLMLRALTFSTPRTNALALANVRLRAFWDSAPQPSIDAPLPLFFGTGTFYNRDQREYLVKAFPVNVRFDAESLRLACYFPMPFFRSARIELDNQGEVPLVVEWSARYSPFEDDPNEVAFFHATYRDHGKPKPGRDLVLLDTREVEGAGDWSGHLVGTSFIFSDRAVLNALEGDPRFFFDDSQTPQAQGTGTEEWGGGGDYWGGQNMTLPFAGHPTGARNEREAKDNLDKIESAYRFLLADLMPFGKNARICLEHGGQDESTEHYQTVAFWYGLPRTTLVKTDEVQLGDASSETAHRYTATKDSPPYEVTSRYEWGVDTWKGMEVYPPQRDVGRRTTGTSEFDLKLAAANCGVMLRRKLDYQFPNQRAEVSIAPVADGKTGRFKPAGTWYVAGSSTCVYSNPKDETGAAQHVIETSNRRFRDDEFLLPLRLTQGRSEIRVRIQFTPVRIPFFPGQPVPDSAWATLRYDAYCFVK